MNQETKVGMFLLVAIAAILAAIIFLGDIHLFERRHRFRIDFDNVEALPPKAAVKISGVEVGKVLRVSLVDHHARVLIAIDPSIALYENATARIGSTGIIGTRFVELKTGTSDMPELPKGSIIKGVGSAGMEQMMDKLSSLFEDDPKYGNAADNLKATISNFRNITDSLNSALADRGKDLESILVNVKEMAESAKVFAADLEDITQSRKEDIKVALAKFRDISERLDAIMVKIQKGEGTIGTLVSDEKTAADVKSAVASIRETADSAKEVLGRVTRINSYWNYRYRYDYRDKESRSDAGVTFVPRPGKFYAVGVTNIGERPDREKETQYERKNRITAVLGGELGPLTGYAGAIRSAGGVGGSFRPLWKSPKWGRRFEFQTEVSDFSRDRVVNGEVLDKPVWSAGAHLALTRWLWVGVRQEDMLEHSAFQTYANVILLDRDFAYLLGLSALAR